MTQIKVSMDAWMAGMAGNFLYQNASKHQIVGGQ